MPKTYYFPTTERIYGDNQTSSMDNIVVKLKFDSLRGYLVDVQPCSHGDGTEGRLYSTEYYNDYFGFDMVVVPANRRSQKKQNLAEQYLAENANKLAQYYTKEKTNIFGNPIVLTGECVICGTDGGKV